MPKFSPLLSHYDKERNQVMEVKNKQKRIKKRKRIETKKKKSTNKRKKKLNNFRRNNSGSNLSEINV